jgi:hypothetical protein
MARTRQTPIGRFGGVRLAQRRIRTSETLENNKEAVAQELIALCVRWTRYRIMRYGR